MRGLEKCFGALACRDDFVKPLITTLYNPWFVIICWIQISWNWIVNAFFSYLSLKTMDFLVFVCKIFTTRLWVAVLCRSQVCFALSLVERNNKRRTGFGNGKKLGSSQFSLNLSEFSQTRSNDKWRESSESYGRHALISHFNYRPLTQKKPSQERKESFNFEGVHNITQLVKMNDLPKFWTKSHHGVSWYGNVVVLVGFCFAYSLCINHNKPFIWPEAAWLMTIDEV